ncbi:MAG TPA: FAD-linked oxidase C-terminal domain-containing protein, partial [Chthoniobacterales bacterium]|nr:FAD-linked oxidase C-terminal domain-containing protein [Chthoniobacterales bacterium]
VEPDGQPETVLVEMEKLQAMVAGCSPVSLQAVTTEDACERFWALRRAFSNSLRATGLTKLNQDIVVPRSRLVDLVEFAEALSKRAGFPIACFGHAGDGNMHVNIMADRYNREAAVREKAEHALDELFAQVLAFGGVITGEHGIGLAKKRWWPQATTDVSREVHRRIKDALDPVGILNPGKFL